MKIICKESLRVATLSGAVVLFEAGVPREVGEEIGKAALVMGADIVSDSLKETPVAAPEEETGAEKTLAQVMEDIIEAANPGDFKADGTPKYYNNKTYPIDIHCPGQLFVTLSSLDSYKSHKDLAAKVINWSIKKMQSPKGYFYYQYRKVISSKIPYMRWSNAFMFNGMSYLLKENYSLDD